MAKVILFLQVCLIILLIRTLYYGDNIRSFGLFSKQTADKKAKPHHKFISDSIFYHNKFRQNQAATVRRESPAHPCRCNLRVAACRRESSRGEGRAEPRSFQPAASRCDKAEPERSRAPPSKTNANKKTDVSTVYRMSPKVGIE